MKPNIRALLTLLTLVLVSAAILMAEKKYLILEPRGGTLSKYHTIAGYDKIILLIEDFEGIARRKDSTLEKENFFSYGSVKITIDSSHTDHSAVASKTCLRAEWTGKDQFGGWGKGVGAILDLDAATDYLNFRVYVPKSNGNDEIIKIIFQEDDNEDAVLEMDKDDEWTYSATVPAKDEWQTISVPLSKFKDDNKGGDGILNVTRKGGIHNISFAFDQPQKYTANHKWYFDFLCFSKGPITNEDLKTN